MGFFEVPIDGILSEKEKQGWYKLKQPVSEEILEPVASGNKRKKEKAAELKKLKGEVQLVLHYFGASDFESIKEMQQQHWKVEKRGIK